MINAEVAYEVTPQVELSLSGKNLGDAFYEYVWWDGAQSLHSPADRANITGSLRIRF